ncbi:hypothetical protein JH06_1526 [Blastocystis sp. subtype 4]|uniref:hypothetical protein n=1 Tax=Blastocystis sp. subtype 4 TaxID=944170 RepID=UPI00071208C9|nr:hypothetical protein JH06_1526 [Blastocystis sp. subtype 4]KNB44622.1 hypothetical protein JH06_1526 [Blastocystis sp. subtype 4]|eukprot:XP_014528065.1 hypothetical protein JH06_1526 [Blastocystis sp. subtype 4]
MDSYRPKCDDEMSVSQNCFFPVFMNRYNQSMHKYMQNAFLGSVIRSSHICPLPSDNHSNPNYFRELKCLKGSHSCPHLNDSKECFAIGKQRPCDKGKKTLVLDLDETLVHSSFSPPPCCDTVIPLQLNDTVSNIYVCVRPGVQEFLHSLSYMYEIVVFTASSKSYANSVLDFIDPHCCIAYRLFRENCRLFNGVLVKDLSILGRDLSKVVLVDNLRDSYILQPANGICCESFFGNKSDEELMHLLPFLQYLAKKSVCLDIWSND